MACYVCACVCVYRVEQRNITPKNYSQARTCDRSAINERKQKQQQKPTARQQQRQKRSIR